MIKRELESIAFNKVFGRQMRFIAGPRQTGKTTLAKAHLKKQSCDKLYFNWDKRSIKTLHNKEPYFYHSEALSLKTKKKKWICFDEIHKRHGWKDVLKDAFDSFEDKYQFIITGSARLDMFRKSGDSLSGRYFLFRLLPISLFELTKQKLVYPTMPAEKYIESCLQQKNKQSDFEHLLKFGGYPEPLTRGNEVFSSNWQEEYIDTLVREDLRDLTKIHSLENVITLMELLPERVGSPLSLNSLKKDMDVSYNAVKSYLRSLLLTYILFKIPPYTKRISRSVKKENKVYFHNWAQVEDVSARFENYVACELLNRVQLWTAMTKHVFDLNFVRVKGGKETDFLITRDKKPYVLFEVKTSSTNIDSHHLHYARLLGDIPFIQIVQKPGILKAVNKNSFVVSAARFF